MFFERIPQIIDYRDLRRSPVKRSYFQRVTLYKVYPIRDAWGVFEVKARGKERLVETCQSMQEAERVARILTSQAARDEGP